MGCPNLSADFDRPFDQPDPERPYLLGHRGRGLFRASGERRSRTQRLKASAYQGAMRVCESVESGHSNQGNAARVIAALGASEAPARLDSQCKYSVVARGQADAYLRLPTRGDYVENIWDHAAGMLIAVEAGAVVTDIDNKPLDFSQGMGLTANRGIVCAAPRFHERLFEIRALGSNPRGLRVEGFILNAMGLIGFLAEPAMSLRFVIGIVAFKPHHLAVTLEGQDMRGHAVQEPTIMGDHHRAAGEIQQRLL